MLRILFHFVDEFEFWLKSAERKRIDTLLGEFCVFVFNVPVVITDKNILKKMLMEK
jgi:hypothetical protein